MAETEGACDEFLLICCLKELFDLATTICFTLQMLLSVLTRFGVEFAWLSDLIIDIYTSQPERHFGWLQRNHDWGPFQIVKGLPTWWANPCSSFSQEFPISRSHKWNRYKSLLTFIFMIFWVRFCSKQQTWISESVQYYRSGDWIRVVLLEISAGLIPSSIIRRSSSLIYSLLTVPIVFSLILLITETIFYTRMGSTGPNDNILGLSDLWLQTSEKPLLDLVEFGIFGIASHFYWLVWKLDGRDVRSEFPVIRMELDPH